LSDFSLFKDQKLSIDILLDKNLKQAFDQEHCQLVKEYENANSLSWKANTEYMQAREYLFINGYIPQSSNIILRDKAAKKLNLASLFSEEMSRRVYNHCVGNFLDKKLC
jgi:hypothetical protein